MPFNRLEHAGAANQSTLAGDIGSGDTSLTLQSGTGWPTGGVGPFYATIDAGTAAEEKILVTSRSTNTLNGITRGADGTAGTAHSAGATVNHTFTAIEADEANQAAHSTLGAVTTKGDLLVAQGLNAITRLAAGSDGLPLVANSAATNGINYATLQTAGINDTAVTTAKLAANAVTAAKNATSAADQSTITGGNNVALKVPTNGITANELADNAVDTAAVAASAVTVAKLATVPCCRVFHTANQGINTASASPLAFNSEDYDTDTMHSTISNTGRIVFNTAGIYLVTANVRWAQNNTGYRQLIVELNGTADPIDGTNIASTNDTVYVTTGTDQSIAFPYRFALNDHIRLAGYQTSGGALNVLYVTPWSPTFTATFLSP
jgi:hypothetical protein